MKVLIVDDQRSMRIVSASIVGQLGHEVIEAGSGQEAIDICREQKVDLILMDVEMPDMNGFEATKVIRSEAPTWFPIIFISAMTETSFFAEGIRSGGDIYLFKPIVREVLESMINAMHRIAKIQDELHSTKVKMELLAHQDSLTGLVNRRGFDNAMELEVKHSVQDKSPLSLVMIDIDSFKNYNDHYGHQQGDECLAKVAQVLKKGACRPGDIVARYGGEEFCIILPGTRPEHAEIVVERIMASLKRMHIPHEKSVASDVVTISSGIAELLPGQSLESLIESADQALYKAKEQGRNQYVSPITLASTG